MTDDDRVVITGRDTAAKRPAARALEIAFGRDQDISGGVELQELRRPLFCESQFENYMVSILKFKSTLCYNEVFI